LPISRWRAICYKPRPEVEMNRGIWFSLLIFCGAGVAKEREFSVHGGKAAYLRVRGMAEKGVKLPAGVGGWYLTVDVPGDGAKCNAEMRDVSPMPGHLPKWIEEVPNVAQSSLVTLDPSRYIGTHTYLMTVKCGLRQVSTSLVHLLAPTDEKLQQKFEMAQKPSGDEAQPSEIQTVPKTAL
jgi:hypothetical protein